jgi:DNA-binding LacI/PurR family transcriptional regulator
VPGHANEERAVVAEVRRPPVLRVGHQRDQVLLQRLAQDIGIVGFDNIEEAMYFTPPLTTVHQPYDAYGRELVRILIKMIEENVRLKTYTVPKPMSIAPELIVRESSRKNRISEK